MGNQTQIAMTGADAIEAAIRRASGKSIGQLTPADYKNLFALTLKNSTITNLAPLSALSNLKTLGLMGCPVTDLTPISGLKKLETFILIDTPNLTAEEIFKLQLALPNCPINHNLI